MAGEGALQRYFKAKVKAHGVFWRKIKFEGQRGCPDTIIAKNGRVMFVELKTPTGDGELSALQVYQINEMSGAGMDVRVINTREAIDHVIKEITKRR